LVGKEAMIPLFLLHFLSFFPHMPAAYYTTTFRRHLALLERAMTSLVWFWRGWEIWQATFGSSDDDRGRLDLMLLLPQLPSARASQPAHRQAYLARCWQLRGTRLQMHLSGSSWRLQVGNTRIGSPCRFCSFATLFRVSFIMPLRGNVGWIDERLV